MNELYVGGREKAASGRSLGEQALVAVAAEEDRAGTERIRLKRVPDSLAGLAAFGHEAVEPGTVIRMDGWPSIPSCTPLATGTKRR